MEADANVLVVLDPRQILPLSARLDAARWLHGRLEGNAPRSRVFALLFGDADGSPIVLPSAKETTAWLSAWNNDVAREVIRREPSLLLTPPVD